MLTEVESRRMATRNADELADTAKVLLEAIRQTAEGTEHASSLRDLAEAYALVAGADPRKPPPSPVRVR